MNLSELCIRRPIMTVLLSASAVVAGIIAYIGLPIAALPSYDAPTISVTAVLPGASPETMASSVATPLERQFSTISGMAVMSSTSTLGNTSITLEFDQDRDIDSASIDVQAALLRAQRALPVEMTSPPAYRKVNPADAPIIFLSLTSPSMPLSDLNSFADKLISPTLSTLSGVAQVNINGQKKFAVRVRVNAEALAARNLTVDDIANALRNANANTPIGVLEGPRQTLTIQANRQLENAAAFANLIVATAAGRPVRLSDIADVEDSVESVKTASWVNGERGITLSVQRQPGANTVATVNAIRATLPGLIAQMPTSVELKLRNDRSLSIRQAIHDVQVTLAFTVVLVVLMIFLFLRKPSATLIPALSLPISLLGTVAFMRAFGYSLDNISLLAITLAVGLVVRRRDRGARKHCAACRKRGNAFAGSTARFPRGELHHRIDLGFVGRRIHSHLLHARGDRSAVPRIRRCGRHCHFGVGRRFIDPDSDAGQPLRGARRHRGAQHAPDGMVRAWF